MQPDRFTVKSQEAVQTAIALAADGRNPEITPAHLLLALLEQEEGLAVPILQKVGADIGATAARAREQVSSLPTLSEVSDPRPSSAFSATLRTAEREMSRLGDSYLSIGHLLLALADSGSGVADLLPDQRRAREGRRRGPGARPRHLTQRRGQRPGAGEIRPRPDQ